VKTQIVKLDQNDDIVSIRDKMSWCQTGRILLVWPAHGRILNRQLDLILAKRYAASLGSELALVTHDDEVRFNAQQVGVPTFTDTRQAQENEWGMIWPKKIENLPRTHLPGLDNLRKSIQSQTPLWMEHPLSRLLCFGSSLIALLALAIFILPGAKVILSPREQAQSIKLDLVADPSATSINLSTGSLPTYDREVTIEGTDSITATGTMTIPEQPASGGLKFTNSSKVEITLPAGTIVTTLGSDRVRFVTTTLGDIVIKPKKSVLAEAQAISPGSFGNLPPNSLVAIESDLGLQLAVTNPEATNGGLDAIVPTPSEKDLQILREQLTTRLLQEALTELQSNLPADDTFIPSSVAIIDVVKETYNPAVGAPTEQVELSLRLKIKAQAVSGEVLRSLATPILDSSIPTGFSPVMNTLDITPLNSPAIGANNKAYWTVTASRKLLADIPLSQTIESIKGATAPEAVERLSESLPLAEQAQIKLIPSWWPRLPFLAMRIKLAQVDTQ
jgi:hypothetical protein